MGKKKSSFHMSDEFNGYGGTRYLKGKNPRINPPLSQENIRLSPDFGNYLIKMLGSIPVIINPANINPVLLTLLGAMASVNQIIITKDPVTGNYVFKFNVINRHDLTDGSYLNFSYIEDTKIPVAMGVLYEDE